MTVSFADAALRRALGAYYTPTTATEYLADWTIRTGEERVLEPSVGDGAFVTAVRDAAALRGGSAHVTGVELSPETFGKTMASPARPDVGVNSDFLAVDPRPVDVVIGNPPFVRLRNLGRSHRAAAVSAAENAMGAAPDPSGSIWLPFVAHASRFLVRGGRLALVLPLEATHVRYARGLWRFLAGRFGSLAVVRVRERIFGDILQDVVLLLADDAGSSCGGVEFIACDKVADLSHARVRACIPIHEIAAGSKPFTRALLPRATAELLSERVDRLTAPAGETAKFNIGYVTGDKGFFHPSAGDIEGHRLPAGSLRAAISSGRRLAGGGLRTGALGPDRITHLYLPDPQRLTAADKRYISGGEARGVDQRYKCRIRDPWYVVPSVRTPDLILTVFSDRPLLLVNDGGLAASNSLLCGYLRPGADGAAFAASWYTPLTLLSIELAVHSLGGGVLILVPGEADAVRIAAGTAPSEGHMRNLDTALRAGDVAAAYAAGGSTLRQALGLTSYEAALIEEGRETLASWRQPPRLLKEVEPDVAVLKGLHHAVDEGPDR